jgi:putative endonuclease
MILAGPRPDRRQALGRLGEAAAENALREAGLQILERRFRVRIGEIDLIASLGRLLVFVEVKTRTGHTYGTPAEAVTVTKQRRIARVAEVYLARKGWHDRPCRFDVVDVLRESSGALIVRHIPDAFRLWPSG